MRTACFVAATSIIAGFCSAKLQVVKPSAQCQSFVENSKLYNCGDRPYDHCKYDGKPTTECLMRDDKQLGHPLCPGTQALVTPEGRAYNQDLGPGKQCSTLTNPQSGEKYKWWGITYHFQCCDCPAGYIPAGVGQATYDMNVTQTGGPYENTCMRCTEEGERLTWEKQKGFFYCAGGPTTTFHTKTKTHTKTTNPPTNGPTNTPGGGDGGKCKITNEGISFIKSSVGFHSQLYTFGTHEELGYAHFCDLYQDCSPPVTEAQANKLLTSDLRISTLCVSTLEGVQGLNQNQFDALVAFSQGDYCYQTEISFGNLLKSQQYSKVCDAIKTANTAGGKLTALRAQQSDYCKKTTTIMSGCTL